MRYTPREALLADIPTREESAVPPHNSNLNNQHIMKKTIITLLALAGVAMGETQYFDFGSMVVASAININSTASTHSGDLNAMSGSYSFTSSNGINNSQTVTNPNEWCDPYTGTLPSIFASDSSYVDSVTTGNNHEGGSTGYFTLTLQGLENGEYSLTIFGGSTGKDCLADTVLTLTGAGDAVAWVDVKATGTDGTWPTEGATQTGNSVRINTVDHDWTGQMSQYSTIARGYQATAQNIVVTDGTLTLKIEGFDAANGYARTYVNAIALQAVPEPTTATLSLLALAGLAARRRK